MPIAGFGSITVSNDGTTGSATSDVAVQDGPIAGGTEGMVQLMSTCSGENTILLAGQTLTTSAVLVLPANANRKSFVIQSFSRDGVANNDNCYIGGTSGVTTLTGIALLNTDTYTDDRWLGDVYVICDSNTSTWIRYWERG